MGEQVYDVQAALLYLQPQAIDFAALTTAIHKRAARLGTPCELELLPGLTDENNLCLGGGNVHVSIAIRDTPCDASAFAAPLMSKINGTKSLDFKELIAKHTASIIVNVGDGSVPMPVEARQQMAEMGVSTAADPILKLTTLHIVMQSIVAMAKPVMVDFCPSMLLLSPVEIEAVADMALPVPILFHPIIEISGASRDDKPLLKMEAIHANRLVGIGLELDSAPVDMNLGLMINILSTLIIENRAGNLPLEHDSVIEMDEGIALQFIEHPKDSTNPNGKIVARLVDPDGPFVSNPRPKADQPQEQAQDSSFQDRIARLEAKKGQQTGVPPASMDPSMSLTSDLDDLPLMPSTRRAGGIPRSLVMLPIGLAIVVGVGLFSQSLTNRISAQLSGDLAAITQAIPTQPEITKVKNTSSGIAVNKGLNATETSETNPLLLRMIGTTTDR